MKVSDNNKSSSKGLAVIIALVCFIVSAFFNVATAQDWPTYQHDNERSGITTEQLELPLEVIWQYKSRYAPSPAWPEPAKHNYGHFRRFNLKPKVIFDRAYQIVAAGNSIYFGSSADDKVYCLDAVTGREKWSFFTEGPVRLAPTIANGKVYVGSDDGWAYCLDAENGKLLWKYNPAEKERRIPGNGRIISARPIRSGIMIRDGLAVFCAGIFPAEDVYLVMLNAENGAEQHKKKINVSPQGYMMAKEGKLFTPTGRTTPLPIYPTVSKKKSKLAKDPNSPLIRAGNFTFSGGQDKVVAFKADR